MCSLPGTASRAVADAASGASERPTSQVVSPTTCDNIVNAVKVVDGFKGDVCSHAPPAPPESCKSGLESLWRRTCMTDGSNCDGLEHGAFTPSAVSNPRMQVRSRPTATQWQWRSDRRSTVAKRGRGTTGASADGDTYRCQGISRKSPMCGVEGGLLVVLEWHRMRDHGAEKRRPSQGEQFGICNWDRAHVPPEDWQA